MRFVCTADTQVAANNTKKKCCTKTVLWRIYVAGNNTPYLVLQVKYPILTKSGVSGHTFTGVL